MNILGYITSNFNLDFIRFEEEYGIVAVISMDNIFVDIFLLKTNDQEKTYLIEIEDEVGLGLKFIWEGSEEDFEHKSEDFESDRDSRVFIAEEFEMNFLKEFLHFAERLRGKDLKLKTAKKYNLR